jgi:hypothetical protein
LSLVKNYADGERVPIRLVQENGDAIELDAISIDMVVERIQSNFGIPFMSAKKFGIDLNQAAVMFEVQGVFTDEAGQEATSGAVAHIDFHQTQVAIPPPTSPNSRSGGQSSTDEEERGLFTGNPLNDWESMGEKGYQYMVRRLLTKNDLIAQWHGKHIKFPMGYWLDQATANTLPYNTNLEFWFDAGQSVTGVAHTGSVSSFTDKSSNGFTFTANSAPKYYKYGANGRPYVWFDGTDDYFTKSHEDELNEDSLTIFTVAHTEVDSAGTQAIFSSRNSNNGGYMVTHEMTGSSNRAQSWSYNTGGDNYDYGDNGSVTLTEPIITSTTITSSAINLFVNGKDAGATTVTYTPATSGLAYLGSNVDGHDFSGRIYEVIVYSGVLSADNRRLIEGYLANKYNIPIIDEGGVWPHREGPGYFQLDNTHVSVYFDTKQTASKREPYGYRNTHRSTGLTVDSGASPTSSTCRLSGNIKEWIEWAPGYNARLFKITFVRNTGGTRGTVILSDIDAGGTNLTFYSEGASVTPAVGDTVYLAPSDEWPYGGRSWGDTVLVLPLLNAGDNTTTNGPTYPNYADGTTRFASTALSSLNTTVTRTDEYIAYAMAQLLGAHNLNTGVLINNGSGYNAGHSGAMAVNGNDATLYFRVGDRVLDYLGRDLGIVTAVGSSTSITIGGGIAHSVSDDDVLFSNIALSVGTRPVNADGDATMDKVFSTSVSTAADGSNTLLTITQVHKTNFGRLGQGANIESNTLPVDKTPLIKGFTGGKSGKTVKSAGDKVQDILGILGNSQNMEPNHGGTIEDFIDNITTALTEDFYSDALSGDYITAIQIPYNSLVTLGQSDLDTNVAQRNFFLTVGNPNTALKTSIANVTHASKRYRPMMGHTSERNGIHGIVTDFNVKRDAAMKAYEFSLKFIAADIII